MPENPIRRDFLGRMAGLGLAGTALGANAAAQSAPASATEFHLPEYACAQTYRSLNQSSFDRTGGNADRWVIEPGETKEVFAAEGPGVITHIWFTISAQGRDHLKELVLRMYWDGSAKPSVETPV